MRATRLTLPYAFIGGPRCETARAFVDGPMHEECARYAAKVCPFLARTDHDHAETGPGPGVIVAEFVAKGRPDRMGLFLTDGYRLQVLEGHRVAVAAPFTSVDYSVMPERKGDT